MTELGIKILELYNKGYTRTEIWKKLGCSKTSTCYYINSEHREKAKEKSKIYRSKRHPYVKKLDSFKTKKINKKEKHEKDIKIYICTKIHTFFLNRKTKIMEEHTFTTEDVIKKFGENPVCYLTGEPIDIYKPKTYQFDHIIPASRGGKNTLDNLGICTKQANMAKSTMTPDEFYELCEKVLSYKNRKSID